MSSLVSTASNWINDDVPNKRVSTMRKTVKNRPIKPTSSDNDDNQYVINASSNMTQSQPLDLTFNQDESIERTTRVNRMLDTITSVNVGETSKMGEFNPISPPQINVNKDNDAIDVERNYMPTSSYVDASNDHKDVNMKYGMNEGNNTQYSNYNKSYEPPKYNNTKPYYANMGRSDNSGKVSVDNKLMEKINYMLHLLEENQHEKTDNITEEFILYTFLGVFIIFTIDAFARTGKYTR